MADDTAETFIKDVETLLNRNYGVTVGYGLKNTERGDNADRPRIEWVYGDGRLGPTEKTGDASGAYYTDTQILIARCWGTDRADARSLMYNLVLAARESGRGPNINPVRYRWLTEDPEGDGNENRGAMLDLTIELKLPVLSSPTAYPTQTRTVTSQTHVQKIRDPVTGHETALP